MQLLKLFSRSRRVYLDYASSTPIDRRMIRSFPKLPARISGANGSALHKEGVALSHALADARALAAKTLEVHADEIIFTSGATESDNLAIRGAIDAWIERGIEPSAIVVFSSDLEHAAVSETIERYSARGIRHNIFPTEAGVVNPRQIILPEGVRAVLVSVLYASNEIGTVQPLAAIARRLRKLRKEYPDIEFLFHTDATQAPAHLPLRVPSLGVDMMTLGATKLYCNKGVGLLYKKRSVALLPIMSGGGQEAGLRPGTHPVALISEFAHALSHAKAIQEKETARVRALQTYFEAELVKRFPQIAITARSEPRVPHITHIGVPELDSELLVLELDARGIAVSAKSACRNEEAEESRVVEKFYGKHSAPSQSSRASWYGAIRFSFGRSTRMRDLTAALAALGAVLRKYQA